MSVSDILREAGLTHLVPKFRNMPVDRFKGLLIQDYDKLGVSEFGDKQALFRLIQELNAEDLQLTLTPDQSSGPSASQSRDHLDSYAENAPEDGFLDLDDDDELLGEDFDADAFSREFIRSTTFRTPPKGPQMNNIPNGQQQQPAYGGVHQQQQQQYNQNMQYATDPQQQQQQSDIIADYNMGDVQPLPLDQIIDPPRIRVIVRKRPLNKKETDRGDTDVLECDEPAATLYVNEPKVKVDLTKYTERHNFRFDDVFGEHVNNDQLYTRAVQPLIGTILRGGKATCFAYGQTGSGKTFTMAPIPIRAAADLFSVMQRLPVYQEVDLAVSCYEIYGGKVFDLLNKRQRLEVREDGKKRVQVVGLSEQIVPSVPVLNQVCEKAAGSRSTGSTGANDESSRSHSIMTFTLRMRGEKPATIGKLSFIDLAGSERGADTYDNDKQTRMEGAEINKSLLALKECIRALDSDARHIPFRGSKLTSVLRDSFIGRNTRTVMIGCVSPNSTSCEHTLNTLRYADRVKEIRKDTGRNAGLAPGQPLPQPGTRLSELTLTPEEALTAGQVAAVLASLPPPAPEAVDSSTVVAAPEVVVAPQQQAPQPPQQQQYRAAPVGLPQQQQQQQQQYQAPPQQMSKLPTPPPPSVTAYANDYHQQQQGYHQAMPPPPQMPQQQQQQQQYQMQPPPQQQQQQQQQYQAPPPQQQQQQQGMPSPSGNPFGAPSQQQQSPQRAMPPPAGHPTSPPQTQQNGGYGGSMPPRYPTTTNNNTMEPSYQQQQQQPYQQQQESPRMLSPIQQQQQQQSPARGGSITGHPLLHTMSDASGNSYSGEDGTTLTNSNGNGTPGSAPNSGGKSMAISARNNSSEALSALLSAEEELIGAHRQHIEESMAVVREEMELLSKLDGSDGGADVERYVEDLSNLLMDKQAAIALLQQQVAKFRRRMRAAMDAQAAGQ